LFTNQPPCYRPVAYPECCECDRFHWFQHEKSGFKLVRSDREYSLPQDVASSSFAFCIFCDPLPKNWALRNEKNSLNALSQSMSTWSVESSASRR
jgi:hypothetical protein